MIMMRILRMMRGMARAIMGLVIRVMTRRWTMGTHTTIPNAPHSK
jgi:hypothetical protein